VSIVSRFVVLSRAACRLKLWGSLRTEASSSPPRVIACVLAGVDSDVDVERQATPAQRRRRAATRA